MTEIIIPDWAKVPTWVCNVPMADGSPCGAEFRTRQGLRLHVEKCIRQHEEEIHTQSVHAKIPELYDSDKELERWAHEHSAEILEGRKRL